MKQILHIFAKDTRHQWIEILLSLSFMTALVITCRSHWITGAYGAVSFSALGLFENLPQMLVLIIPLGWWLLISPLIHDESLVGDRQFWITRPYEWKKLLAAKALFLIVFLYAPLFLTQLVILTRAGFEPFSCIPGLLYDMFLLSCAFVLPLLALATVTRNFARMTLAVLGALACFVASLMLASNVSPDRIAISYGGTIALYAAICLCIAVVVLQYARRKVKLSWILLGLLVVLLGAFNLGGAPDNATIDDNYPHSSHAPAPVQLDFRAELDNQPSAFVTNKSDRVGISIPVHVSGVADGAIVIPDFLKVTLRAPDGSRWTSVWQSISMDKFFPGDKVASERFTMPRAVYDSFRGKSLMVEMDFALTEARAANSAQVPIPVHDFAVSGVGVCTPLTGVLDRPTDIAGLTCRAPLRQPELTLLHTTWSDGPCATTPGNEGQGIQGAAWVGSLERAPADFGIFPVWSSYIGFTNQQVIEKNRIVGMRKLCPGTPLIFTAYRLSGHARSSLSISGFHIPELNRGQQAVIDHD